MKSSSQSLNRIYGDPQLRALSNRIKYIQSKHSKLYLPQVINCSEEATKESISNSQDKPHSRKSMLKCGSVDRNDSKDQKQGIKRLLELRSQRYREMKQNSQQCRLTIKQNKDKQIVRKRIKRRQVLMDHQRARAKLQAFEQSKLSEIRRGQEQKRCLEGHLQLKRIQLKRRLMQEQQKSLDLYEQALSYKSELMRRIKQLLTEQ